MSYVCVCSAVTLQHWIPLVLHYCQAASMRMLNGPNIASRHEQHTHNGPHIQVVPGIIARPRSERRFRVQE